MKSMALVKRALQQDSRSVWTYCMRFGLLVIVALFMYSTQRGVGGASGRQFFTLTIMVNFFFITVVGIYFFSSSIAEEKEDGTLPLLRMTALGPMSIVMGKFVSRFLKATGLLFCQLPFTFFAVTLGGVTAFQIIACYLAMFAYLVLLANLGLLYSIIARTVSAAVTAMVLTCLGLSLGVSILKNLDIVDLEFLAKLFFPVIRMQRTLSAGYAGPLVDSQFYFCLVVGVVLFFVSSALFDRLALRTKNILPSRIFGKAKGKSESEQESKDGNSGIAKKTYQKGRRIFSVSRPWSKPLAWKELYFTGSGKAGMCSQVLVNVLAVAVMYLFSDRMFYGFSSVRFDEVCTLIATVSGIFLFFGFILSANNFFSVELHCHTLPVLAMLPGGFWTIVRQKILGSIIFFLPSTIMFLVSTGLVADYDDIFDYDFFVGLSLGTFSYITFLILVILCSMCFRRGALVFAFVISMVASFVYQVLLVAIMIPFVFVSPGRRTEYYLITLTSVLLIVASVIMGGSIYKRYQSWIAA